MNHKKLFKQLFFIGVLGCAFTATSTDIDSSNKILCDTMMKIWTMIDLARAINTSLDVQTDWISELVDEFLGAYGKTVTLTEDLQDVYYLLDIVAFLKNGLNEVFPDVSSDELTCIRVVMGRIEQRLHVLITPGNIDAD